MAGTSNSPPASTFIVRFWREWSAAGSRWRGRIEHVQSGESAVSLDLQGILDFIQRCGVMPDRSDDGEAVNSIQPAPQAGNPGSSDVR
jgi:hypothetical protein